jgi:hypothetical protein
MPQTLSETGKTDLLLYDSHELHKIANILNHHPSEKVLPARRENILLVSRTERVVGNQAFDWLFRASSSFRNDHRRDLYRVSNPICVYMDLSFVFFAPLPPPRNVSRRIGAGANIDLG